MPSKREKEYSLEEAVWKFAPRTMQREMLVARSKFPVLKPEKNIDPEEAIKQLPSVVSEMLANFSSRRELMSRMLDHIFTLLQAEKLVAVGVQTKPTLGSGREPIPAYLFDRPEANFGVGTIENFGRKFEAVKILKPDARKAVAKQSPPRSTGRPSKNADIEKAIDALEKEGLNLSKARRKEAISFIRSKAKTQGANVNIGFSDPVIQKVLVRRFGPRT